MWLRQEEYQGPCAEYGDIGTYLTTRPLRGHSAILNTPLVVASPNDVGKMYRGKVLLRYRRRGRQLSTYSRSDGSDAGHRRPTGPDEFEEFEANTIGLRKRVPPEPSNTQSFYTATGRRLFVQGTTNTLLKVKRTPILGSKSERQHSKLRGAVRLPCTVQERLVRS